MNHSSTTRVCSVEPNKLQKLQLRPPFSNPHTQDLILFLATLCTSCLPDLVFVCTLFIRRSTNINHSTAKLHEPVTEVFQDKKLVVL